ncbi:hypothetical protein [Methylobacterium pseudosasicola]|uniref:Beta-barrel assembly machine subunit BamF n=1 Tax=Methylobacterium pseudosasicola TaxID=582667 RepID=A0A1I4RWU5_9HYPH|nr:hypothetical protein [Methylobacterium pseudosasicola]SFM56746.1 hypothetical protein SAMN05192568_103839 [Methylobacterium pseudosasicola]
MISVKRIAALGLVLLAGACSRLPNVPTAYSALPRTPASGAAGPVVTVPETPAETVAALPRIVIPGTMTVPMVAEPHGLNPNAALDTSRRSRMTWEALRPGELVKPPVLAAAGRPAAANSAPQTYDREAAMDRLLKGGRNAASGICSGC